MTNPKWGTPHVSALVQEYHDHVRRLIAERAATLGRPWSELAGEGTLDLLNVSDLEALEQAKLATGYRFDAAATVSVSEEPDKYKPIAASGAADTPAGVPLDASVPIATGDNVREIKDVEGTILWVRTIEQVFALLSEGVPANTVALIDDSGGTLTAPILKDFTALLCLGGTVRSHLAILSREYSIPCLMNVEMAGALETGDRVRIEYSTPAMTAAAYDSGGGVRAKVWKISGQVAREDQ